MNRQIINISQKIHGAIIISTPDDKVWYRGSESLAPRDNILFEMGLFIKALGTKHVALIFCNDAEGKSPKMPTDIHGLNVIFFDKDKSVSNESHLEKWIHKFKQFSHPMYFHLTDAVSEFVLNTTQYYDSILAKLSMADSSTTVRAISLVSPDVWTNDPHQKRFYEYNVSAKKNGATIQRLFIASDEQISDHWTIIQQQLKDGFEIKTIHPRIFSEHTNLDDSITFADSKEMRCYKTIQFYDNPYKLKGARLILNDNTCKEQIKSFDTVWKVAKIPSDPKFQAKKNHQPPGLKMKALILPQEVVTCGKGNSKIFL
ncbi:MAG: nucleotide-binding protein [Bacteroidales bacterium]|nr:nucleotide-binding protein [Bacteroidales bacterium]